MSGYMDWRLPNEYELQSIVDYGRYNPAIDTGVFPGTNADLYWSSSTGANDAGDAWGVDFYGGGVDDNGKAYTDYVRCVR